VALLKSNKLICSDVDDGSLINLTVSDVAGADEFSEPCCGLGVVLIVVVHKLRKWFWNVSGFDRL